MDVPMPIWKALLVDSESKVVNHLIHGEYELTNTSWSKLQKKYHVSRNKIYTTIKGKGRPGGSQYRQKRQIKNLLKLKQQYQLPPWNLSRNTFLSLLAFCLYVYLSKRLICLF